jgi:hypothetical protein
MSWCVMRGTRVVCWAPLLYTKQTAVTTSMRKHTSIHALDRIRNRSPKTAGALFLAATQCGWRWLLILHHFLRHHLFHKWSMVVLGDPFHMLTVPSWHSGKRFSWIWWRLTKERLFLADPPTGRILYYVKLTLTLIILCSILTISLYREVINNFMVSMKQKILNTRTL